MRQLWPRLLAVAFGWLSLSPAAISASSTPAQRLPEVVLWAWERPTDLRGLDARTGVAFLAQTITIGQDSFRVAPRRNPLRVAPTTPLISVTRIESEPSVTAALNAEDLRAAVDRIVASTTWAQVVGLQIDFDATDSERPFYRRLLTRLRAQVDPRLPVSITALASWCAEDRWLEGLPIDEAVPMLFRMGPTNEPYAAIGTSPQSAAPECRTALGVSLDEPFPTHAGARRMYVFNASPWTPASVAAALRLRR